MKIHHVAIWTKSLEKMRDFYIEYFNAKAGTIYKNELKGFSSYFLKFDDGTSLELMNMSSILENNKQLLQQYIGIAHIAFSVGSENNVNSLTERLVKNGYKLISNPRRTGDGYYESCFLDPENNFLEITV